MATGRHGSGNERRFTDMTTVALKGRTYTEKKRVSLKERIAESVRAYFEEFGAEIACGMLSLSGNTNAACVYQMLRK
jgi:hypothetical protein